MEYLYSFKGRFLRNEYEFYRHDSIVGELKFSVWSRVSTCTLNSRRIIFRTKGFFRSVIFISNTDTDDIIGTINIHRWKSAATISYGDRQYLFSFDNFWHTRWVLSNNQGTVIKYTSRAFSLKGEIQSYTSDEVLILSGLVIRNYFSQRSAAHASAS